MVNGKSNFQHNILLWYQGRLKSNVSKSPESQLQRNTNVKRWLLQRSVWNLSPFWKRGQSLYLITYVCSRWPLKNLVYRWKHIKLSPINSSCRTAPYKYVHSFSPFSCENNLRNTNLYVLFKPLLNNAWYIAWLDIVFGVCVCFMDFFFNWLEKVALTIVTSWGHNEKNTWDGG